MHSSTVECRSQNKADVGGGKKVEVEVKGGGSLSLCHHVGAAAGLGLGRIYRESLTPEVRPFDLEVKGNNTSNHQREQTVWKQRYSPVITGPETLLQMWQTLHCPVFSCSFLWA